MKGKETMFDMNSGYKGKHRLYLNYQSHDKKLILETWTGTEWKKDE